MKKLIWKPHRSNRVVYRTCAIYKPCQPKLSSTHRKMSDASPYSTLPPDPYPHVYTQVSDWKRSEEYHNSFLIKDDDDLASALRRSEENQLPNIGMSHDMSWKLLGLTYRSRECITRKTLASIGKERGGQTNIRGWNAWRVRGLCQLDSNLGDS